MLAARGRLGVVAEHPGPQELAHVGRRARRARRPRVVAISCAGVHSACTVIWLRVRVPVLSEATTVVLPSVSTAGSRRTMARRRAIRCTPMASAMVTTAGRPSGTAATARLIPASAASPVGNPRIAATTARATAAIAIARVIARPTRSSWRVSGVSSGCCSPSSSAIRPSSVSSPVATATPSPDPAATVVPA